MAELDARICCSDETRTTLKELARDDERYEDVLQRLVNAHKENGERVGRP